MGIETGEEINRWTARRNLALVLDIIQGNAHRGDSSRQFGLPSSEIDSWIHQAKAGMQSALKAKPEDGRELYATRIKVPQKPDGEAIFGLRPRKKWHTLLAKKDEA